MKKSLCLLLIIILILGGCTQKPEPIIVNEIEINAYFGIKDNEGLDYEKRIIEFENDKDKYIKAVQQVISGPKDTNKFETNINKNTKVLSANIEGKDLTIDLSKDFDVFENATQKSASVASIVGTLLQFKEVERIKITIEGNELTNPEGEPYGFMDDTAKEFKGQESREVVLYFADSQAMFVVPEKRTVSVPKNASEDELAKIILEELVKGPKTSGLYKTIPEEVTVNTVELEGDLARVDFSSEMHTKHWRGAAGEQMTVASIVNSLTELSNIKRVLLTVEGEPMNIEHMYMDEPIIRMQEIIINNQ
jgi:germination protein M